ncbi:MAG: glycosyltransferase family 9 protein [Thermodesulfovibrionales bacterium]
MQEKNPSLDELRNLLAERDARIALLERELVEKDTVLQGIYQSGGWKLLRVYYAVRDRLLPLNTRRRLVVRLTMHVLMHPHEYLKKLNRTNMRKLLYFYKNFDPAVVERKIEQKIEESVLTASTMIKCESALFFSHMVEVSGWAISREGIERIDIYCGDALLGTATYGQPRPDVESAFPSVAGSLHSGFFFHSVLQSDDLTQGSPSFRIRAVTVSGGVVEVEQPVDGIDAYGDYLAKVTPTEDALAWMREVYRNFAGQPRITVALGVTGETCPLLPDTLHFLMAQTYPLWQLALFHGEDVPSAAVQEARMLLGETAAGGHAINGGNPPLSDFTGDFFCFMTAGDLLAPDAFFRIVQKINTETGLDLIYTDEDSLREGKRQDPFFKPGWSPDLLLGMNYIGDFFLVKKELFYRTGGLRYGNSPEGRFDLLLRATESAGHIGHVPLVLYTRGGSSVCSADRGKSIIEEALQRRGISGTVVALQKEGAYWVQRRIEGSPRVSIIIPTMYGKPGFFDRCIGSIVEKSTYRNCEIIIIDTSRGKLPLGELKRKIPSSFGLRVIEYKDTFNYSRVNNLAAAEAEGDYFLFLNDDTEVITPGWIEALLEYAQQPGIGVVGAKLLYDDESIQHGGIFLVDYGGGGRHAFRFFPSGTAAYYGLSEVARNCSAVTFACVMVPKRVFREVGGLDEGLRIECNDVDFCLRAGAAGYSVVWTPFAVLYHKELTSRGPANVLEDVEAFWNRWRPLLEKGDPYYNPNLTLEADNFSLNKRPVIMTHHEPNRAACFIPEVYRSSAPLPKEVKNILVLKLDHLGDLILSLPAVALLKRKFPGARITLLVGSWARAIAEATPDVDEVLTFDFFDERSEKGLRQPGKKEKEMLAERLHVYGFDLAIDFRKHPETREILLLSGARYTAGFSPEDEFPWLSFSLKLNDALGNVPGRRYKPHITLQLAALVDALPVEGATTTPSGDIEIPKLRFDAERNFPERYTHLRQAGFLAGVHPGAGGAIKQWPARHFARLADMLIERDDATVIIFGGRGEKKLAADIRSFMKHGERAVNCAGEISLAEFMAMAGACHLFVGNDSGPCHISGIMGAPTLVVSGGQVMSHEWHPLGQKTLSVRLGVGCAPCYRAWAEQCPYDLKCLRSLWPERVWEASRHLLALSGALGKGANGRSAEGRERWKLRWSLMEV